MTARSRSCVKDRLADRVFEDEQRQQRRKKKQLMNCAAATDAFSSSATAIDPTDDLKCDLIVAMRQPGGPRRRGGLTSPLPHGSRVMLMGDQQQQ